MAKDWYDENTLLNVVWFITGAVWLPIYVVYEILQRTNDVDKPKWLKWWGNRVDNLTDSIVEYLHCKCIPGINKSLNLAFMMKNRGRPYWPILRDCGFYENCDPEDQE